ncbi:MAG: HlyD family efflux transporter periplasmic adaptor subunit [Leadbetterella sp.]|nr:HlyD family efflux transporter periplasmic adaptor subunit [Leadbetterella sp.]
MENSYDKKYTQDNLSMRILNARHDEKPLGKSANFEKDNYGGSEVLGINKSIKDIGFESQTTQSTERRLKGLGKAERSDLVKEVLEAPPSWLVKWGSTWTLLVVLMILAISWFVEYPDLVKGVVQITSEDIAKTVTAKKEGLLAEIYAKEGQIVKKNERIGLIESIADTKEIEKLKTYLIDIQSDISKNGYSTSVLKEFNDLGEIQQDFQSFAQVFISKSNFDPDGVESEKKSILNRDLLEIEEIDNNLQKQIANYKNDFNLAKDEYANQLKLNKKGLISANELRLAESKVIAKKQQIDQTISSFNTNQLQKNQKKQEILSVRKGKVEQTSAFKQEVNKLLQAIENWEKIHYLIASTDGKLIYLKNIQINQQLKNGESLFYILPNSANAFGEMYVGQYNIGKIKVGQRVILKFDGYPYQEFGTMDAKIATISDIPIDSVYKIKVLLPNNELKSFNKNVKIKVGMTASGEIVTEDLRLIEKLFYEIRKYVKR